MLVTCAKCGKVFNRGPAQVKKNRRGKHFCSRECLRTYECKEFIGQYGGRITRESTVRQAVKGLTYNRVYHIDDIRKLCREAPGKREFTRVEVARMLHSYCYDMVALGRCQWKRVAEADA